MTELTSLEGIPLSTVLRINSERTIPLERYEEEGNFDRYGYIRDLANNYGVDLEAVLEVSESVLGPNEDFDGLVAMVEDMRAIGKF